MGRKGWLTHRVCAGPTEMEKEAATWMITSLKFSLNWLGSLKGQLPEVAKDFYFSWVWVWFLGWGWERGCFWYCCSMSLSAQAFDFPNSFQICVSPRHLIVGKRVEAKWIILELSWDIISDEGVKFDSAFLHCFAGLFPCCICYSTSSFIWCIF